jgi:hypothetical protein
MIRLLQIVLGFLILYFLYLAIVSTAVVLPMLILRASKEPTGLNGVNYSLSQESFFVSPTNLKFSKVLEYDSTKNEGSFRTYIETANMKSLMTINDTPYAKNSQGQLVQLQYDKATRALQVPVPLNRFNTVLFTFVGITILYLLFIIFLSFQLFQFAKLAGRKEFFSQKNRIRLRILGAFLIVTACVSFFLESSGQWFLESLTGTWGYKTTLNTPVFSFPSVLISGLLMFIIADAFSKGQQLQTEQEYTV